MAEILGNRLCMESLQTDIQDVQWTINDVSSRIGPINLSSWKFPDKLSWEIDIEHLLDMYSFTEDEKEENQVAHIALYELLIDRLVLLVQGTAVYISQVQQLGKGGSATAPLSTSVGLAVKHFWAQMTNLQTLMQQLQSQNKTNTRKVAELEKELKKSSASEILTSASSTSPNTPAANKTSTHCPTREISCDESNKGSQTLETAFVPCEACDVVQKKMREAGDLLIDICQTQGLPSSLRKYRPQISHVQWLTYNDVSRWMSEQNKDVQRLCKHIEQMSATISPLKAEVAAFEKETKQAESHAKQCEVELNREKETHVAVKKLYEVKLQEKEKQHEITMAELHRQKEELIRKHTSLSSELSLHETRSTQLQCRLKEWESKCEQLEKEVQEKGAAVTCLAGVEQENSILREQLSVTRAQLETTSRTLAKEQGKNRSAAQHKEQVQAKQESLSERVSELVQENEELRDQVSCLEEEKQELQENLQEFRYQQQQLEKEKKEQEIIIKNLNEEKRSLEQSIQETEVEIKKLEHKVEEAKERERLIIEYPDLNGPVNPDLQGTGNVALDMENQVKANMVRIHVLEEQNEGLRRSISKIHSCATSAPIPLPAPTLTTSKSTAPIPLWQSTGLQNTREKTDSPEQHISPPTVPPSAAQTYKPPTHVPTPSPKPPPKTPQKPEPKAMPELFTVGKAAGDHPKDQRKSSAGTGGRHSGGGGGVVGGGVLTPVNSTSIGAYKQIKRAMGDAPSGQNSSGKRASSAHSSGSATSQPRRGSSGQDDYTPPAYVCERCDKMYTKPRDLEIHKSYCTG